MITDTQNQIFSILKNTSSNLVIKKGQAKLIFKTYTITSQSSLNILQQRARLNHPHLITISQIQLAQDICGLAYQHYTQSLNSCVFQYQKDQNDQEIINTFQPILQAIDHLNKNLSYFSDQFSLKNIVINQNLQVKYLDNFFLEEQIQLIQQKKDRLKIYQKIALSLYSLLFPKENSKSWKNKLKFAKQKTSHQMYNFLASIFKKSLTNSRLTIQNLQNQTNFVDTLHPQKIKKIKKLKKNMSQNNFQQTSSSSSNYSKNKQSYKKCSTNRSKSKFQCQDNKSQKHFSLHSQYHQGKQNKIFQ